LRGPSPGKHPPLGRLLAERSADGRFGGFLGSERSYALVRRLERELRVVPIVGDLAGDHALGRIGDELRRRGLSVGAVYVSNVEQYLFENATWDRFVSNLVRLPHGRDSVVVRSYLDQGTPHPRQQPGHRTTTLTQPIPELIVGAREGRFRSWQDLVAAS
jgi:hypothetical protein